MNKNDDSQISLPYNGDIDLLDKMIADLKTSGKEGVNLETHWANIGATKNIKRSYTLSVAQYLNLVDNDNKKIWLTDFGSTLRYATKEEKNRILASKMPDKYLTMFKWIIDAKELRTNEIKRKYIETWGRPSSPTLLDRAITTFLNYCNWLGIIIYQGRGNQAKALITDFGRRILEIPFEETTLGYQDVKNQPNFPSSNEGSAQILLPKDATYPIIIKTNDRGFDWDIKSETDWNVIDSVIKSIKDDWGKTHQKLKEVGGKGK